MTPSRVKKFLKRTAKRFNPRDGDLEVDQCAICLEDFSEKDGNKISQLECSKKHIFHLKCIIEWVEKSDICPLCREPIQKRRRK
mmetsp:Transcript_4230/g.7181  ORF Transcript_4230/g.7181 Transcript_4230/m.7181 type:complete len:84 (+) Transcript_4230:1135-1386(+)